MGEHTKTAVVHSWQTNATSCADGLQQLVDLTDAKLVELRTGVVPRDNFVLLWNLVEKTLATGEKVFALAVDWQADLTSSILSSSPMVTVAFFPVRTNKAEEKKRSLRRRLDENAKDANLEQQQKGLETMIKALKWEEGLDHLIERVYENTESLDKSLSAHCDEKNYLFNKFIENILLAD